MHEELDPTRPRREVVGQNKDLRHGTALPGSQARRGGPASAPTAR
jgi:hypothetical protein